MTNAKKFAFESIQEVAKECVKHIIDYCYPNNNNVQPNINVQLQQNQTQSRYNIDDDNKESKQIIINNNIINDDNNNNNNNNNNTIKKSIILGGWSYGGVVSVEIAKELLFFNDNNSSKNIAIDVKILLLFDSPLRAPKKIENIVDNNEDNDKINNNNNNNINNSLVNVAEKSLENNEIEKEIIIENNNEKVYIENMEIENRTKKHFENCTNLLKKYHKNIENLEEIKKLNCAIVDFKPTDVAEFDYTFDFKIIEKLTRNKKTFRKFVSGNHWTMMFQKNVENIVDELFFIIKQEFC
jgi:thioesterase domain-containing protein